MFSRVHVEASQLKFRSRTCILEIIAVDCYFLFLHPDITRCIFVFSFFLQGRPGEKGQKGELGSPGFDVFSAVKVSS